MRERSPGHWELRAFTGRDPLTGKPTQKTQSFRGGQRAAAKALGILVAGIDSGKVSRSNRTVGQLLDAWLEAAKTKQTPRTLYENERKIEKRIRPALGHVRLDQLDAAMLDRAYREWEGKVSPATVHKYHCILSAALRQAVKWDWIDSAPTAKASPSTVVRSEMMVPTPKQLSSLVRAADESDGVMAAAVALAALTGARRGELVALRWSDIDLDEGSVRIARSLTVANGERHTGPTKNHAIRVLALDPICIEVLRRRWAAMTDLSMRAESPLVEDPYVLSYSANGATPAPPDGLTHRFHKLCEAQEAKALESLQKVKPEATKDDLAPADRWPFRFHDLRHFSVTTLIAAGVDVRTVATRHGHARATMTLDRYAHALPERDREAAGVLGAALTL